MRSINLNQSSGGSSSARAAIRGETVADSIWDHAVGTARAHAAVLTGSDDLVGRVANAMRAVDGRRYGPYGDEGDEMEYFREMAAVALETANLLTEERP